MVVAGDTELVVLVRDSESLVFSQPLCDGFEGAWAEVFHAKVHCPISAELPLRGTSFVCSLKIKVVCATRDGQHCFFIELIDTVGRIVAEPSSDCSTDLKHTDRFCGIRHGSYLLVDVRVNVSKHAKPDRLLVAIKKCSETLSVLMTALVGNMTDQNGLPSFLLYFAESVSDELQVIIGIIKRPPEH